MPLARALQEVFGLSLVAFAAIGGCAVAKPLAHAQEIAAEPVRDHGGAFLDGISKPPRAAARADAAGVVALLLPPSRDEVLALVRAYFRAFVAGNPTAFAPLLCRGARRLDDDAGVDLEARLNARVRSADYTHVSVESLISAEDVLVYAAEDAPSSLGIVGAVRDGDVVVDVPTRAELAPRPRLFGSHVRLIARRPEEGGALQIAAVGEDASVWP